MIDATGVSLLRSNETYQLTITHASPEYEKQLKDELRLREIRNPLVREIGQAAICTFMGKLREEIKEMENAELDTLLDASKCSGLGESALYTRLFHLLCPADLTANLACHHSVLTRAVIALQRLDGLNYELSLRTWKVIEDHSEFFGFRGSEVTLPMATLLCQILPCMELKELDLLGNKINDDTAEVLASINYVEDFVLTRNSIGARAAEALAANTTRRKLNLEKVDVTNCKLTDADIIELANCPSIRSLHAQENRCLTVISAKALVASNTIMKFYLFGTRSRWSVDQIDSDILQVLKERSPLRCHQFGLQVGVPTPLPSLLRLSTFAVQQSGDPKSIYKAKQIPAVKELMSKGKF